MSKTLSIEGLQIRGDTSTNFALKNPILKIREMAYETDTKRLKIGDGVTYWNNLGYWGEIVSWENVKNKPTLFSGDYNDLDNKPTIPDVSGKANLSGADFTGDLSTSKYLRVYAWAGYGSGNFNAWYDGRNSTLTCNAVNIKLGSNLVSVAGHKHTWSEITDAPSIPNMINYYTKTEIDEMSMLDGEGVGF